MHQYPRKFRPKPELQIHNAAPGSPQACPLRLVPKAPSGHHLAQNMDPGSTASPDLRTVKVCPRAVFLTLEGGQTVLLKPNLISYFNGTPLLSYVI